MPDNSHNHLNDIDPDLNFLDPLNDNDLSSASKYYSIQEFKQLGVNKSMTLSIVHLNIRSFGANFDKFRALFASCNLVPDIVLLHWPTKKYFFQNAL